MHGFFKAVGTKSLQPIISALAQEILTRLCRFSYSKVKAVNSRGVIFCTISTPRIFIGLAADKLNMTVKYVDGKRHLQEIISTELTKSMALFFSGNFEWYINVAESEQRMIQVLEDIENYKFLYCTVSHERQSFNFLFWILLFDTYGWTLLGISLAMMSFLFKRTKVPCYCHFDASICGAARCESRIAGFRSNDNSNWLLLRKHYLQLPYCPAALPRIQNPQGPN